MAASMKTCRSDSSSSDSSSSEDENLARLREAAVTCPVTSSPPSFTSKDRNVTQSKTKQQNLIKPSLRPAEKTHEDENTLQTTPEFRAHVAKKLSRILDSSVTVIEKSGAEDSRLLVDTEDNITDSDFRLFTTSVPGKEVKEPTTKRRRLPSSSSDSSDEDRFMSCAVSGDAILAQSRIPSINNDTAQSTTKDLCSNSTQLDTSVKNCEKLKKKSKKKKKKKEHEQCVESDNASDHKTMNQHKKHKKKKSKEKDIA